LDVNAHAQRWLWLVKRSGRVQPLLFPQAVLGPTVSACASSDGRTARPQDSGQVVLRFASSTSQIRDGPLRRRHRLSGLLKNDHREAAGVFDYGDAMARRRTRACEQRESEGGVTD